MARARGSGYGLALLALVFVVFVVLGITATRPVRPHHPARPAHLAEMTTRPSPAHVAAAVAGIRGRSFERIPKVSWVSPGERGRRAAHARTVARRKAAEHPKRTRLAHLRARRGVELLTLFGVVGPRFSVGQSVTALTGDVQGTYAPSDKRIQVVESPGESRATLAITLAHELDHALDAQTYPRIFHRLRGGGSERELAWTALVEGTAVVVEETYAQRVFGSGSGQDPNLLSPDNAGFGVPPALAAELRFPYTAGAAFVRALYRRAGGWRLVDFAFRRPPVDTEQILQPGKFLSGDLAPRLRLPIGAAFPAGWRTVYGTDSGELDARLLLALGPSARAAEADTRNWDGGRFELYQRPGAADCAAPCRRENAAVLAYRWDDRRSAARFVSALPAYLGGRLSAKRRAPLVWAVGDGYAAIALDRRGTAVAFAPAPGFARRVALAGARGAQ